MVGRDRPIVLAIAAIFVPSRPADKTGNVYAVGSHNGNKANLRQESGGMWNTA